MVCVQQVLYYVFPRSSRQIILPAPTPTQHASYALTKTRFICLVCTGVVPPHKRRATRRMTQMYFSPSCTRACKARVRSPRDHVNRATALIAALSLPRCCYRKRDLYMHCVPRPHCTPSKSPYTPNVRLTSPFSALFFFFLPPPQYISPDFCHCVLHSRHTSVTPRSYVGGGVVYGSISTLLPTWQYHSYLCTVQGWRFSVYVA